MLPCQILANCCCTPGLRAALGCSVQIEVPWGDEIPFFKCSEKRFLPCFPGELGGVGAGIRGQQQLRLLGATPAH